MKSKSISLGLALAAVFAAWTASATVTNQGWWHLDTAGNPQDASGNGRNFVSAFSTAPNAGGTFGVLVIPNGVGGVLDGTGYTSTNCIRLGLGVGARRQSSTWNTGYVPPPTNYGIECWLLPQDNGIAGGTPTWVFSTGGGVIGTGPAGGVVVRIFDNGDGTSSLRPGIITGPNSAQVVSFGDPVQVDTNRWIHLAIVNNNGIVVFYTNGIPCATNDNLIQPPTDSAGVMYIGTDGDNNAYYGYMDELRLFTFDPGQFNTSDLLLPPAGPVIVAPPQNTTVWNGGVASFTVTAPFDFSGDTTFQWRTAGTNITGATSATLYLPTVTTANSGTSYSAVVTKSSLSVTSAPAVLTVVPVQTADVNAYRTAVTGEGSLLAYFPVDDCTGSVVSNIVDSTHDGVLELNATYESRTNRAFGQRAITADADGDVAIPANSAYEFAGGNGTVEAIVYMSRATVMDGTIFSVAGGFGQLYYAIQAGASGSSLVYTTDQSRITWTLGSSLIGQRVHVAVVIDNLTNVTAYVNGQSLGTQVQSGFGFFSGQPAWIGSVGNPQTFFADTDLWAGSIDEVAVYGSALSQNAIQTHYTKYAFGTNTTAPSIVSQPGSKTLYAGGSPTMTVVASGSLPIAYQWRSNNVPIPGATSPSFTLLNTTTGSTANYSVTLTNSFGVTNGTPFTLTFVNPPTGYVAAAMSANPISYWRLDEAAAAPAAVDSVGLNDATYFPNVTNAVAGVLPGNASADFGASGRAQVNYTATLNPSGAWAIEFWANPNTTVGGTAASSQFRVGNARNGFAFYYNALGITGWFVDLGNGAGVFARIISGPPPAPGNWTHVAFTTDGTTGQFYVNGVLQGTAGMAAYAVNPSAPFTIGRRSDNTTGFNGRVDEVAFYNHALSPAQIANHVTLGGLPTLMTITPITSRVVDSKSPLGSPHIGINNGAIRQASVSDGSTTRDGVMQFIAANRSQITVATADTNFDSAVGTVTFWMRAGPPTGAGNEGAMLFDRRTTPGNAFILNNDGRLFVQANPGGANTFYSIATLTNNLWRHVAVTYDQNVPGDITVYIDGVADTNSPNVLPWVWPPGQQIELGASHDGYWRAYNGFMDDVRIYNRVLSGSEVAQVKNTGAIVDSNALILQFTFDSLFPGFTVTWNPSFPTLQSSTNANGPYLDVTSATYLDITNVGSPYFTPPSGARQFFRTRQQ